ncbi:hypothetical protein [Streptomyces fagopyri]|nr:hypothetical protein [Streptomyces fagopyri]
MRLMHIGEPGIPGDREAGPRDVAYGTDAPGHGIPVGDGTGALHPRTGS